MKKMSDFNQQNLANMAWAIAVLEIFDTPLLASIAASAHPINATFAPQGIANIAWALARCSFIDKPLFQSIS